VSLVDWSVDGAVATATLNDPARRNALSGKLRGELTERYEQFEAREDLRVLVLAGAGPAFCAGGDLAEMPTELAAARRFLSDVLWWLATPERLSKPVIAAVEGPVAGGGLELAIACDLIVASQTATFSTPEALVGLAPAFGMVRLNRIIGPAAAKRMAFTGLPIDAAEAFRLGLVSELVPAGSALPAAQQIARSMLRAAPLAQAVIKSALNRDLGGGELAHARDGEAQLYLTADCREGIAAFGEKRKPTFRGH
jgi:enoyl-CoA hydratase/carnithine racemase